MVGPTSYDFVHPQLCMQSTGGIRVIFYVFMMAIVAISIVESAAGCRISRIIVPYKFHSQGIGVDSHGVRSSGSF